MVTFTGYVCKSKGAELEKSDFEVGELGPNEVDIKVTHCGMCYSDVHVMEDDWGVSKYPFVPGHEVIGVIQNAGPYAQLKVGQRVGLGWQKDSCLHCTACVAGKENICEKGQVALIIGGNGGYASTVRASCEFVYEIPDGLDSAEAAPLLCAGHTVYAPLKRFLYAPGLTVGIIGIGGLGHLAIQIANAMGANVIAISHTPDKEQEALGFGASRFVTSDEMVEKLPESCDVIMNTVYAMTNFSEQLKCLRPGGFLIIVGGPAGEMEIRPLDLVGVQKGVVGSTIGSRTDMRQMLNFCALKGIKPMIEVLKMSEVNKALEHLKFGKPKYRIVLEADW